MPRKYELLTFEYSELSDKAKKVALEEMRERASNDIDTAHITELFAERLEELGYPTEDINWSLSCCQGDGVAFYGSMDFPKVAARLFKDDILARAMKLWEEGSFNIKIVRNQHGTRYSRARTMHIDDENTFAGEADIRLFMKDIIDDILSDIRSVSADLERMGYAEIAYYTEDTTLIDDAEANDIEFTANGKIAKLQGAREVK